MPDGWTYTALGQYLWQYPRGANGGLAPLYQYGFAFSETRFVASSFLGFLSPFFSFGDTEIGACAFLSLDTVCLFVGLRVLWPGTVASADLIMYVYLSCCDIGLGM